MLTEMMNSMMMTFKIKVKKKGKYVLNLCTYVYTYISDDNPVVSFDRQKLVDLASSLGIYYIFIIIILHIIIIIIIVLYLIITYYPIKNVSIGLLQSH